MERVNAYLFFFLKCIEQLNAAESAHWIGNPRETANNRFERILGYQKWPFNEIWLISIKWLKSNRFRYLIKVFGAKTYGSDAMAM